MTLRVFPEVLDVLCPMHIVVGADGLILHVGPTTQKLRPHLSFQGRPFLELVRVQRPRKIDSFAALGEAANRKLHLELEGTPPAHLKGVLVPNRDGSVIINLSFGISILDAVRDYALTNSDFAATDLAIEMLYLVEAKTAAMESSRKLNLRLQGAKIAAEEQAYSDALTGLGNRRALDQLLEQLLLSQQSFAVMHIDLDYFKTVNDTHGHAAGDHVLKVVARAMQEETRSSDMVARIGGDEFTVVLPAISDLDILEAVGQRIIDRIEVPIPFNGNQCRISASIGTVWISGGHMVSRDTVLEDADIALYASKNRGRAQQTFYTPELRKTANSAAPPKIRKPRRKDH